MKAATLVAVVAAAGVVGGAAAGIAKCRSGLVSVWPPKDALLPAESALVLVEGYGADQARVLAISDRDAALVAGSHRVPLKVWRRFRGDFNVVVAALTPVGRLRVGQSYVLTLPFEVGEPTSWVARGPDLSPPRWTAEAAVFDHTLTEFGCGPASEVWLDVPVADDGPVALLVNVKASGLEDERHAIVPVRDGRALLGHGMCSGEFIFKSGQQYAAVVEAIDLARNVSPSPVPMLKFHGPTAADGPRYPDEAPGTRRWLNRPPD